MTKRGRYSAECRATVALEPNREERTTAELARNCDFHPTMIAASNLILGTGGKER